MQNLHQPIATPGQRLEMVRRAIESEPALMVDACEIRRKSPSKIIVERFFYKLATSLAEYPICFFNLLRKLNDLFFCSHSAHNDPLI